MTKSKDLVTVSGGLKVPADLAGFYKENAGLGSEELSGALPQLKINESNSHNEAADGSKPAEGTFYHKPTKESFKTLRVSITAISRGFYGIQKKEDGSLPRKDNGDIDTKYTQLIGGVILNSSQPFIMFASGSRLQNMWNFGKEIKPFTKQVPMFSFQVELGLEKVKSGKREWHIVTYKVIRDKKNQIELIADRELLSMFKSGVDPLKSTFGDFINNSEVDRYTGLPKKEQVKATEYGAVEEAQTETKPTPAEDQREPTDEELNDADNDADGVEDDVPF